MIFEKQRWGAAVSGQIIIRKAQTADLEALAGLLQVLFTLEADFTVDLAKQLSGLKLLVAEEALGCLLVATVDGKIAGMCSAQLLVSTAEGGYKALVEDVVVATEYRRRGIAQKLLAEIEHWALARGAKRLDLLAVHDNTPALTLYGRLNWRRTELIALQKTL